MTQIKTPCRVNVDGTIEDYPPVNGKEFTLKELQEGVGGYIEVVPFWDDHNSTMFANEEGLLEELDLNVKSVELTGEPLVGPLLIIPNNMVS